MFAGQEPAPHLTGWRDSVRSPVGRLARHSRRLGSAKPEELTIDAPILRINCYRANEVQLGPRTRAGVLISGDDVKTLRLLAERDISVTFMCNGRPVYEARVQPLLRRLIHVADRKLWYLPTSATGPLTPPRLPAATD